MESDKTIYVICCNDSIEYAVVGNKGTANLRLQALKDADIERKGLANARTGNERYLKHKLEQYENQYYWHIHIVEGE